ncbi:hypothetical protein DVH24_002272 [Malus domestica]|uniref:Leucine-rich repeat-containing N-terminal plant-type domain-containing protein n=1 Tax=Malus domestica TaxID=3750 RepID=A0A498I991_MALDO|nr:hypothetical protein DVH24_002272 [Malus domestica]
MNCTNLIELHLGFTYLERDHTTPNFSKLSHLNKLDLIGITSLSLKAIWLGHNPYLEGQIQPKILSLNSLSFLSLVYGLIGQILGWFSNLKNLEMLDLGGNQITGSIPSWLGTPSKTLLCGSGRESDFR